ncbi:hypothetical protein HUK38_00225 [Thiospirillum jenense]|uniref:Uncharacterized protein n=1 Tax=Thiospirillum jenense TaxID=1653858 RepID=A0A839HAW5_9GAMM|nr:hypothetical protein [Thiospirillum jenense]MBB1124656.1 hypothetical protein [Thiospirillum jenense]
MNAINVNSEPVALRVWTIDCMVDIELTDGRVIGFATDAQLTDVSILDIDFFPFYIRSQFRLQCLFCH